jgi:hypothetical protein
LGKVEWVPAFAKTVLPDEDDPSSMWQVALLRRFDPDEGGVVRVIGCRYDGRVAQYSSASPYKNPPVKVAVIVLRRGMAPPPPTILQGPDSADAFQAIPANDIFLLSTIDEQPTSVVVSRRVVLLSHGDMIFLYLWVDAGVVSQAYSLAIVSAVSFCVSYH